MGTLPKITDSEWMIMTKLWEEAPLTAAQIVERVQTEKSLGPTTVKTLLRRLITKKAAGFRIDERNAKLYYYFPLVSERECVAERNKHFLSLYHKDNMGKMFASFAESEDMTDEEIDMLKTLLDKKRGVSKKK